MNEEERQAVLLAGFMGMLMLVFLFLFVYAPEPLSLPDISVKLPEPYNSIVNQSVNGIKSMAGTLDPSAYSNSGS